MSQTLKYEKKITTPPSATFHTLMEEQLKYFKFYDSHMNTLHEGSKIKKPFYTKTTKEKVNGTVEVTKIIENELFQMKMAYSKGEIIQTYAIKEEDGNTKISYTEENTFDKKRDTANFSLVSIPYRFLFKRQVKKRMKYLEEETLKREGNY